MDRIPPQCAAILLAECAKSVVGKHLIERVSMRIVERHRGRRMLAMVHDQLEGAPAEFVGEPGPVALHTMPRTNRGQRRPHTRMPVKNSAAGIETKRLDVAHTHDVIPPSQTHRVWVTVPTTRQTVSPDICSVVPTGSGHPAARMRYNRPVA